VTRRAMSVVNKLPRGDTPWLAKVGRRIHAAGTVVKHNGNQRTRNSDTCANNHPRLHNYHIAR
jgi:hypothetical protein